MSHEPLQLQLSKMAARMLCIKFLLLLLILLVQNTFNEGKTEKKAEEDSKKKSNKIGKDVLDFNDADVYKLLDQWDDNDDDMDEDDKYDDYDPRKPKKPLAGFDPSKLSGSNPADLLKLSKKNKVVMVFVSISGNPTKKESEVIASRWQTSLFNAQYQVERYMVSDDRALFLLKDGSTAWDVKDFLITQPECKVVEFDNQKFPGAGASEPEKTEL